MKKCSFYTLVLLTVFVGGCHVTMDHPTFNVSERRPTPMVYCDLCNALVPLGHVHVWHRYRYGYTGPGSYCHYHNQCWSPDDPYARRLRYAPVVGWE